MSKDSDEWNRDPRTYRDRKAIVGSLREIVNKYAAGGWLVAQMGPDGGQRFGKEWVESSQFPGGPEDDQES